MKRVAALVALGLVVVGVASAARGDPQKQLIPADQARARAMLLRKADVPPELKASKSSSDDFDHYCKALDESDLVLTGEADSPNFAAATAGRYLAVSSAGQVYQTAGQSAESWRRGTSSAGLKCAELGFRKLARQLDAIFIYFQKVPFPSLAPQTIAYQVKLIKDRVALVFDVIWLRDGRAQSGCFFAGAPSAYPREGEVRLAKIVARRTARAMRTG